MVVPVSIVTGFLGAGKTTLLNYILSEKHGWKIAIIENEFSEDIGVESLILKNGLSGPVADGFYELQNGCMCCTNRDGLVTTIEKILDMDKKFDYILIETSGLANPGPVASMFWTDIGEDSRIRLDSIITVVDSSHILQHLTEVASDGSANIAEEQIACADVLLLNKRDLLSDEEMMKLKQRIRLINEAVQLIECEKSVVNLDMILEIQKYGFEDSEVEFSQICGTNCSNGCSHSNIQTAIESRGVEVSPEHTHDSAITTVTLRSMRKLNREKFISWISTLLWSKIQGESLSPDLSDLNILRGKGVLYIEEDDEENQENVDYSRVLKHIFQSVCEQYDLQPMSGDKSYWGRDEVKETKLIFIGRGLRKDILEEQFFSCLM